MNEFRVIANDALDFKGQHYNAGDVITMHCDDCAPLLVLGRVRLETTPAPEPPKRKRGRPRKLRTEELRTEEPTSTDGTYQRRDLRAEE